MIRSRDVNKELKVLDERAKVTNDDNAVVILGKSILKALVLGVKLVRDIKTNQVRDLESRNVELIKEDRTETK